VIARLTSLSGSIAGKVVIVTGAASGMGRATAHLAADEGAKVGIVDRDEARLRAVAHEIEGAGGTCHAVVADVTQGEAVDAAVAEIRSAIGPIDGLVNNAGIGTYSPIDSAEFLEHWDATIAVNLTSYVRFVRACLDDLRRDRAGRIVNIASTAGVGAAAFYTPYTVSKHGVIGLTRALAVELGPAGVTVNCVCPGPINTAMTAGIPDADKQVFAKRRTALRRYGDPEEVAHGTLALLVPSASYITGAILPVDGGLTARNG
jgi:3-oxoacyl-[acyl-carrier protein] reductase